MLDMEMEIQGLDKLDQALSALPGELALEAGNKSLLAGAQVLATAMADLAPRDDTHGGYFKGITRLEDSIAIEVEKHPIGSAAEVYVGPNQRIGFIARYVEFGTAAHRLAVHRKKVLFGNQTVYGTSITHPGGRPNPFIRQAFDQSGPDAVDEIVRVLREEITRAAQKVKR